jgi:hypothetical protein
MTKDELIEMAEKVYGKCDWHDSALAHLEQFATLVAEEERRACARVCAEVGMWDLVHEIEGRGQE